MPYIKDNLPYNVPYQIYIDPSNLCNFKCNFCPTGNTKLMKNIQRPAGMMKMATFKKFIDDTKLPPKEIMPHQMFVFSYYLKHILRQNIKNKFQIINYCEQEPNPNSRLYLSSEKDYFGKNKLIVDWKIGKREIDSLEFLHNKLNEQLIEWD